MMKGRDYGHLTNADNKITIIAFGSLVSEESARNSFPFTNYRYGTIQGYVRIFNRASWVCLKNGQSRRATGEVCSLALAKRSGVQLWVALLDVSREEGIEGFLRRETNYDIWEVPFVDEHGGKGVGLACGECSDEEMRALWGPDNWYFKGCTGRISYSDAVPPGPIPLAPAIHIDATTSHPGDPSTWLPLERPTSGPPYANPDMPWVYPSPGYLRLVHRAHSLSGRPEILNNFLQFTLLMDRQTPLSIYLEANPALKDFVMS